MILVNVKLQEEERETSVEYKNYNTDVVVVSELVQFLFQAVLGLGYSEAITAEAFAQLGNENMPPKRIE